MPVSTFFHSDDRFKINKFVKAFMMFGYNYEYGVLYVYVAVKHWYLDITRELSFLFVLKTEMKIFI